MHYYIILECTKAEKYTQEKKKEQYVKCNRTLQNAISYTIFLPHTHLYGE